MVPGVMVVSESSARDMDGEEQANLKQLFFEDLRRGMLFEGDAEITRDNISKFAEATGDTNVAHQSIAHGMLLASLGVGVVMQHLGSSEHKTPIFLNANIDFGGMMRVNRIMSVQATVRHRWLMQGNERQGKILFNIVGRNSQTGRVVISACGKVLVPKRNRSVSA